MTCLVFYDMRIHLVLHLSISHWIIFFYDIENDT
ncbi:hypothetical protein CI610_03605 [invertebrate metagenome]|uniref:Uncharacterized protein n=1 Tax=invertebrate metagenome TaxID=1711999 RepID=A0A2H9T2M3_9ZZZZ